jgi:ubiquinol-cytochrome c reductase subunit 6
MEAGLNFPSTNYYADGMHVTVNSHEHLMARGMDPKPLVLDFCKPQCVYWKEKLERCEKALEIVIKTNPTKSCMYPMRDWVTCVEACVSVRQFVILFLGATKDSQSIGRN